MLIARSGSIRERAVPLLVIVVGLTWALCSTRGLVDDAYITLRYAENWARHGQLVWNPGGRVEGYSNFLWMALLTVGLRLNIGPELAAQALGLTFWAGTVIVIVRFVNRCEGKTAGWIAGLLVGLNWSHVQAATMGLETPLQLFLLALMMHAGARARAHTPGAEVTVSVVSALGFLTRMDFALLATPWLVWVLGGYCGRDIRERSLTPVRVILPGLSIAGFWLGWKLFYYGSIFPNTAAVKLGGASEGFALAYFLQGIAYCAAFLLLYGILPAALLGLRAVENKSRPFLPLGATAILWSGYMLCIGGDWMEFRLALPLLLLLAPLAAGGLAQLDHRRLTAWLLLLVASSFWMSKEFGRLVTLQAVSSRSKIAADTQLWSAIGRELHAVFPRDMWHGGHVRIATTAAGAVPYFSQLWTYDLVGLNTPEVAREGVRHFSLPGHAFHATVAMVERAGVHLVLGRPDSIALQDWPHDPRAGCQLRPRYFFHGAETRTHQTGEVLGLPLGHGEVVPMWYLTPSIEIEQAIENGDLMVLPCP